MPELLRSPELAALGVDPARAAYILSRNELLPARDSKLSTWRRDLFRWMQRNSPSAAEYLNIPPDRVIELGTRVTV